MSHSPLAYGAQAIDVQISTYTYVGKHTLKYTCIECVINLKSRDAQRLRGNH